MGEQSALPHDRKYATAATDPAAGQSRPERGAASRRKIRPECAEAESPGLRRMLDKLFARASLQVPDWTTISLRLPNSANRPAYLFD